jgi:hypothetical protein
MDIAKDLNKQLVDQINKMSAIQINEAADDAKNTHLLMCVRYVYLGRLRGGLTLLQRNIRGSSDAKDSLNITSNYDCKYPGVQTVWKFDRQGLTNL